MGLFDGTVSRIDGAILLVFFLLYLAWLFRQAKKGSASADDEEPDRQIPLWKAIVLIVIGAALVMFGSDVAVNAAKEIAKALGMNDRLIGLTIIALGTSLPELVTSAVAAKKGSSDMALGNIIGSNLFNILLVLGTSAVITPIAYPMSFMTDSIIGVLAGVLLWVLLIRDLKLKRSGGMIMLAAFAGYYLWLFLA